jgi:ABC-type oligopeptide transport system ATPase subunit
MAVNRQAPARVAAQANPFVDDPILELRDLKTYFFLERGVVKAVDGVTVSLGRKKTLGVVGESGCG